MSRSGRRSVSDWIGKTLGPYQVLLKVRTTPVYTLYKAYHSKLGRIATLLLILPGQERPAGLLARLQEHARKLGGLSHPSIAPILDCEEWEGEICLAFDFVPKSPLRLRFNEKLNWVEAARRLAPAAQGLAAAHKSNVFHGCLRPGSIFLTAEGSPVLFDLGVEEIITAELLKELPGSWIGCDVSSYLAPERVLGRPCDARADIYSLGMLFYELLFGRRAYEGETPILEILQQLTLPASDLAKRWKDLPEPVRELLSKALALEPAKRFGEMQHFAVLLARLALGQPLTRRMVRDPNYTPRMITERRRVSPLGLASAALFSIAVLAVLSWGLLNRQPDLARRIGLLKVPSSTPTFAASPVIFFSLTPAPASRTPERAAAPAVTNTSAAPTPTKKATPTHVPSPTATPVPDLPLLLDMPMLDVTKRLAVASAPRAVKLARWGIGQLTGLDWEGGKAGSAELLALGTSTGIYLLDPSSGNLLRYINAGQASAIAFAPGGGRIASGDERGLVQVWDTTSGALLDRLPGHLQPILDLAYAPDGRRLASASGEKACLWEGRTCKELSDRYGPLARINTLSFSPDGSNLATGGQDFYLRLWDANSAEPLQSERLDSPIQAVEYSPDGKLLLAACDNFRVYRWEIATDSRFEPFSGFDAPIVDMHISPDGQVVAASDHSGRVIAWNAEGKQLWEESNTRLPRVLETGTAYAHFLAFSPDSTVLASGIWDNTLQFWNMADGTERSASFEHFSMFPVDLEISPNSQYLAAQNLDGTIRVFDILLGEEIPQDRVQGELAPGHAFSYDSRYLAYKKKGTAFAVIDLQDGAEAFNMSGLSKVSSISFSSNGDLIASGDSDHLRLWTFPAGKELTPAKVDFAFNGCKVVAAAQEQAFVTTGEYIDFVKNGLEGLCDEVRAGWMKVVDFTNAKKLMAAGGTGKLLVWNFQTQTSETALDMKVERGLEILEVALSADGSLVAAAAGDQRIYVWSTAGGEPLVTLDGHLGKLTGLAFSPDGRFLFSSSEDGTILVWGVYP